MELEDDTPATTVSLPNSCLGQADTASTMLKLSASVDDPIVNAACDREWAIINLQQDNEWTSYFRSMRSYRKDVMGPVKDDHVNWKEWLTVEMEQFIVSPDCATCDDAHELNQLYGTASGYYMTPVTDGCTQLPIGRIGCDMDWYTSACRVCETSETREPGYWNSYEVYNGLNDPAETMHFEDEVGLEDFAKYGLCGWTIRDAKAEHSDTFGGDSFQHCKTVTHEDVLSDEVIIPRRKPSIGNKGKFCVCVKPEALEQFEVPTNAVEEKELRVQEQAVKMAEEEKLKAMVDEVDPSEVLVKLYQKDFEDGTYRITQPGKYVIMEDITFDFKAPSGYLDGLETYNDDHMWWPTVDDADEYDGAGDLSGSYFLGFWAGITIECDDVILELNSHSLQMSEALFYQQSFFALISLTSQVFLPGQGPGFFGADPRSASNVMIRNGELGLSSHHAIQGNFNRDVLLENLNIHNFKTHGIQFNGFNGVTMRNLDIGPNRKVDVLSPYYAHMKALLPTYRIMLDREEIARDSCITLTGPRYKEKGCVTLQELVDDVQVGLDMAFETALRITDWDQMLSDAKEAGTEYDDEEMARKLEIWAEVGPVLMNQHHSTQTATLYGVFLNYIGSNVIGWYAGSASTHSHDVTMDNVKIHDLHHDTRENIAFSEGDATANQRILNCLNAPFNAYHIFGNDGTVDVISECNNWGADNGDTEKCHLFQQEGVEYVGNIVTDIQLLSFELINNYGMSWNYCAAGAADLTALTNFAVRGTPFEDGSPLLVGTHDPMIHPGKGVMGLRLNGVDSVDLSDVKIQNIHSSTGVGSLLGGVYEQVVSQQAPYMNGFSMNMVKGLSATFTTNMALSNVHVDHITSATGLAYGVSTWYDTEMQIVGQQGLSITNIHAGKQLAPSNEYRKDSYPNLKPEACALRVYGDVIYSADIQLNANAKGADNIFIQCVTGHTGCRFENDEWSNIGAVEECQDGDDDDDATALYGHHRASNNEKNDGLSIDGTYNHKKGIQRNSRSLVTGLDLQSVSMLSGAVVVLSALVLLYFCVCHRTASKKAAGMAAECSPLLVQ